MVSLLYLLKLTGHYLFKFKNCDFNIKLKVFHCFYINAILLVQKYIIMLYFAGTEWSYEKEVTLSSSSVTGHSLTGLTPETTYEIRLITLNSGSCEQSASYSMNFRTQSEDETVQTK